MKNDLNNCGKNSEYKDLNNSEIWLLSDWNTGSRVNSILSKKQGFTLPEDRTPNHFSSWDEVWYFEDHYYPDMRPCPEADEQTEYLEWIVESVSGWKVKVKSGQTWSTKDFDYKSNDVFTKSDICDLYENNALSKLKHEKSIEELKVIKLNTKIKKLLEEDWLSWWVSLRDIFEAQAEIKKISSNKPKTRL